MQVGQGNEPTKAAATANIPMSPTRRCTLQTLNTTAAVDKTFQRNIRRIYTLLLQVRNSCRKLGIPIGISYTLFYLPRSYSLWATKTTKSVSFTQQPTQLLKSHVEQRTVVFHYSSPHVLPRQGRWQAWSWAGRLDRETRCCMFLAGWVRLNLKIRLINEAS